MKVNSQYMHTIRFNVVLNGYESVESILTKFIENPFVAVTYKDLANQVFSFGRDHGYYGRIFNQTVISIPTLNVVNLAGTAKVTGFCFTPQDGNSLLSSVAAAMYAIYGKEYISYMSYFNDMLFDEV